MSRRIAILCVALLALAGAARWGLADWVWNKDTGWVNMGEAPPSEPVARFAHASALMTQGDYAPALEQLQGLYAQNPPISLASKVKLRMAECLLHLRRYGDGAQMSASLIDSKAPGISLSDAWRIRYDCAAAEAAENPQAGAAMLDEASVVTPENLSAPEALLKAAEAYAAMKQPDKATVRLERLREKFPSDPSATPALKQIGDYRAVGCIERNSAGEDLARTADAYSQYLELNPQAKDAAQVEEYVSTLQSASSEPDADRREVFYGVLLLQRGETAEAVAKLSRLSKAHVKDDTGELASYYLVLALAKSGNPSATWKACEEYLKQYPGSAHKDDVVRAEYAAGGQLLAQGSASGVAVMDATVSHDPQGPVADDAMLGKGNYLLKQNDFVEATKVFEDVRDKYSVRETSPEALFRLGQSILSQYTYHPERTEILTKARETFDLYVKEYPNGPYVKQARDSSKRCLELEAEHMWSIAQFYLKQQLPDSAAVYMTLITTDYPDTKVAGRAKIWLKNRRAKQ